MEKFFNKYKPSLDEGHAIGMIHDEVEKAYESYKNHKGDRYMRDLSKAYQMICDLFEVKGIDINAFYETEE